MKKSEKNYSSEWIHNLESPYHWNLYRHQLDLVMNHSSTMKSDSIIELGVGSGFTSEYLRKKGYSVQTIDIDEDKNPDIVADITDYDFSFAELYIAFEIFEHIPLESAQKIWKKLASKEVKRLAFSLPYAYKTYFWSESWSPFIKPLHINIGRKRNHINAEHHFWELGINNMTPNKVSDYIMSLGYSSVKSYRYRNHHFFLFEKA